MAADSDLGVYQFPTTVRVGRPQGAFKNIGSWKSHLEIWGFLSIMARPRNMHFLRAPWEILASTQVWDQQWSMGLDPVSSHTRAQPAWSKQSKSQRTEVSVQSMAPHSLKMSVLIISCHLPLTCSFLGVNSEKQNHLFEPYWVKRSCDSLNKVDREDRCWEDLNSLSWFHLQQPKWLANLWKNMLSKFTHVQMSEEWPLYFVIFLPWQTPFQLIIFLKKGQTNSWLNLFRF